MKQSLLFLIITLTVSVMPAGSQERRSSNLSAATLEAFTLSLSAVAAGQNLTDRAHAEFTGAGVNAIATTVPRSVRVQLMWRFQ